MTNNPNPAGGSTTGTPSPGLIYVVDDEPLVAEVVETILSLEGYQTRLFLDPVEASLVIRETPPDLLVTDFLMPSMNGMELIQTSKEAHPDLKTILISGNVQEDILERFALRPDRFIRKPFYPQTLINIVSAILRPHPASDN